MRLALVIVLVLGCSPRVTPPQLPPAEPAPAPAAAPAPAPDPTPVATPAAAPAPAPAPAPLLAPAPTAADLEASPRAGATQSQAAIAARLNDDARRAIAAGDFAVASAKLREAVARVPEAGYFFNLCVALYQEGRLGEALTSCQAVEHNAPRAALLDKATKLIARIKAEAKAP